MAELDLSAHIAAPAQLVYAVVADVEQYPAFLPDVGAVDRDGDRVTMTLWMGLLSMRLVTQARFNAPESIELIQLEGPFRRFDARWSFLPTESGTEVRYRAEYELPLFGSFLGWPAGVLLRQQTERQIRGFEARVLELAARADAPPESAAAPPRPAPTKT
jgi:ribosome-associated toxin RatA of RatAB toxin-antitoxin module